MTVRLVLRDPVPEATTALITAILKDERDQPIPGDALDDLSLTLYAVDAEATIINERDDDDILGANGGDVDGQGNLSLELEPDDNAIVDDTLEVEEHILLFEWTYDDGKKAGKQELLLKVVNLEQVPDEPAPP